MVGSTYRAVDGIRFHDDVYRRLFHGHGPILGFDKAIHNAFRMDVDLDHYA